MSFVILQNILEENQCLDHLPNRFLTLAAPTPTNISSNSAPEQKKNGTPASPATAFASNVLPVPGAPTNNIPEK